MSKIGYIYTRVICTTKLVEVYRAAFPYPRKMRTRVRYEVVGWSSKRSWKRKKTIPFGEAREKL